MVRQAEGAPGRVNVEVGGQLGRGHERTLSPGAWGGSLASADGGGALPGPPDLARQGAGSCLPHWPEAHFLSTQ